MSLVSSAGVLRAADHPGTARTLSRLCAAGRVVRLLPGIYADAAVAHEFMVRCAALMLWDRDAVITGLAAARLGFWNHARVEVIEFHSTRKKTSPPGYRLHRSSVPPEEVAELGGLRVARRAWAALHLARRDDGEAVDAFFRARRSHPGGLDELRASLARGMGRWGNKIRRRVLRDSRDAPWSQAERALHRLLREAGITGWVTNHPVQVEGGWRYLDLAFLGERLVIEVDSFEFHGGDRARFEDDRARHNALVRLGWESLHITWTMLQSPEMLIPLIRDVLRSRKRRSQRPTSR